MKNPTFEFLSIGKQMFNIRAILYNWTTGDRMKTRFSLNNRPKQAETLPH